MEMLEHHAELLATVYAISGTLLGVIIGVAAWIGYGRISDIKDELSESLDTKLDATRRVSDRDHEQVAQVFNWYMDAEKRMRTVTEEWNTRLSNLHQEAVLKATYSECNHLSVVARALKPLSQSNGSANLETAQMLASMLEKMIATANRGIQLTTDKWWMIFRVFNGVALKDLGRYEAALV
jgi:hypothetical protein